MNTAWPQVKVSRDQEEGGLHLPRKDLCLPLGTASLPVCEWETQGRLPPQYMQDVSVGLEPACSSRGAWGATV